MNNDYLSKMSHMQRMEINHKLRQKILTFLVEETFTTLKLLSRLIMRDYSQTHRLVTKMIEEGLLVTKKAEDGLRAQQVLLVGITRMGMQESYKAYGIQLDVKHQHFMPSRCGSLDNIRHKLGIQLFVINGISGYCVQPQNWPMITYPAENQAKPIPDFYLHLRADDKAIFAVEYERTIKSRQRYAEILADYEKANVQGVIYLFDDMKSLLGMSKIIANCMPRKWHIGLDKLFFGLDDMVQYCTAMWDTDHPDESINYGAYSGYSELHCVCAKDLLSGYNAFICLDYSDKPYYEYDFEDVPAQAAVHEKSGNMFDELGRLIPVKSYSWQNKSIEK